MKRALLLASLLLACTQDGPPAGATAGHACGRTADCVSGLRCEASLCVEAEGGAVVDCDSFAPKALDRLKQVDPDMLAPREALDILYELRDLLQARHHLMRE